MESLIVFSEVNVSWGMALVDFIPVVFFSAGMGYLLKMTYRKLNPFWYSLLSGGAFLGFFAGLSKCTWKLLYAAGFDFAPFNVSFAVYQTVGFLLIAIALIAVVVFDKKTTAMPKVKSIELPVSILALLPLVLATVRSVTKPGFLWYICMGIFTSVYLVCMAILTIRRKMVKETISLVISFVCMWTMAGLKSQFESGGTFERMNWIAQIVNSITQLAMAYPAFMLCKKEILVNKAVEQ